MRGRLRPTWVTFDRFSSTWAISTVPPTAIGKRISRDFRDVPTCDILYCGKVAEKEPDYQRPTSLAFSCRCRRNAHDR